MKAFPNMTNQQGMDLRDYFAAQAMNGNIAASESGGYIDLNIAARWAYSVADAMMKAREEYINETPRSS